MKLTNKQKEFIERVLKTFIQGALGYIITVLMAGGDFKDIKAICCGVVAAGLSALMNAYKLKGGDEDEV